MKPTDDGGCEEAVERWPNRRIFLVAAVVTLIIFTVFHLPQALSLIFTTVWDTVILLILAVTLSYVLIPLLDLLMKLEWPSKEKTRRSLYAILSIIIFFAVVAGLLTLIITPLTQQLGVAVESVSEWASEDLGTSIDQATERLINVAPDEYKPELRESIQSLKDSFGGGQLGDLIRQWGGTIFEAQLQILQTLLTSGAYIIGLVVVPIVAYFFLTDAERIREGFARHLPPHTRPQFHRAVQDIDCTLRAYVRTIVVVAAITGVTTGLLLLLAGVPAYLPLGALTGLGAMVPVLGPVVAVTITMIVTLLTVGLARAAIVLLIYGGIEIASDRILAPELMAEGMHLHPLAVILALMIGGQFFGVIGVFVAVPVLATLRILYIHATEYLSDEGHREEIDEQAGPKEADEDE